MSSLLRFFRNSTPPIKQTYILLVSLLDLFSIIFHFNYFVLLIVACDIITLSVISWAIEKFPFDFANFICKEHSISATRISAQSIMIAMIIVATLAEPNGSAERTVLMVITVITMLIAILIDVSFIVLTFNAQNPSWLADNHGAIGVANWISLTRLALSLIIPYIFVAQPFHQWSWQVGAIYLIFIQATDGVDGFLARKLNQTTKAGKYLDPLGDKIVFYPVTFALLIATEGLLGFNNQPCSLFVQIVILGGILVAFLRDLLLVVWFKIEGAKLPKGISSSYLEKIRMVAMFVWLDATALSLCTIGITQNVFLAISFISLMLFGWMLSPTTFFTGWYRVKHLKEITALKDKYHI